MPQITLWFLQTSRSIRIAWLLEELNLDYEIRVAKREGGSVPAAFKDEAGGLGMFPTVCDGDNVLHESGNITEYLCDKYDTEHKLLPPVGDPLRYKVLYWLHAAEGTFAMHATPTIIMRHLLKDDEFERIEEAASGNFIKDMDFLEKTLQKSGTKFLLGDSVTAADCMMHFIAASAVRMKLGEKGRTYENVDRYVQHCEFTETYKKAVAKSGHSF